MSDCITREDLVDLISVFDRPVLTSLDHLTSCEGCRAEVASLEQVRGLLRSDADLPAGFVDRVMTQIEKAAVAERGSDVQIPAYGVNAARTASPRKSPARFGSVLSTVFTAVLSGVAVSVTLVAGTSGAGVSPSLPLLVALLATIGLIVWELAGPGSRVLHSSTDARRPPV
jgi:anti-sigma factor RsiW